MAEGKKILLLRYDFVLEADGNLRSAVDYINPEQFSEAAGEWEEKKIVVESLKYIINGIQNLDNDFEKFLKSL